MTSTDPQTGPRDHERQPRSQQDWWRHDWDDFWQDDRLDAIGWAAGFTWGGLVLLAQATGFSDDFDGWDGWGVFLTGAGVLVLVGTAIRILVPDFRRKIVPSLIFGLVLLGFGIGDAVEWIWAAVLISIGAVILLQEAARRR